MSKFMEHNGESPVSQDFIWMAEYLGGDTLTEFDAEGNENSFYDIEKERIARFGLVGNGMKLYFEEDGVFNLNGTTFEVVYEDEEGNVYPLTGLTGKYKDIITFKDAESALQLDGGVSNKINKFNFGYKANLSIHGVIISFKAICVIPYNEPVFMNMRVVADKPMNGKLRIKKNNQVALELDAPIEKNKGGEVNVIA